MAEDSREGNIEFTPRPYQLEIFEKARKENVIVCLGTGTGKTFISVMLIKDLAHQIKGTLQGGGKRTFFLVTTGRVKALFSPNVNLCRSKADMFVKSLVI